MGISVEISERKENLRMFDRCVLHGWYQFRITSDQCSCFTAELTRQFLEMFGCTPKLSAAYHPQGNSLVERLNQTFKNILHHVVKNYGKQWHKMIQLILWCIRESKNVTLDASPFQIAAESSKISERFVVRS